MNQYYDAQWRVTRIPGLLLVRCHVMEASDWLTWAGYCYVLETRVSLIIRVYGHIIIIIIMMRIIGHAAYLVLNKVNIVNLPLLLISSIAELRNPLIKANNANR